METQSSLLAVRLRSRQQLRRYRRMEGQMSRRAFIKNSSWGTWAGVFVGTFLGRWLFDPKTAKAQIGPAILVLMMGSLFCCALIYVARRGGSGGVRLIRLQRHYIGDRNPDGSKRWENIADNWIPLSNDPDKYFAGFSDQMNPNGRAAIYRCIDITDDQFQPPPPGPYKTAGPVQPPNLWITVPSQ